MAAAVALALPAATASADPAPSFRDTVLPAQSRTLQSASLDGYWGGPTTAASGETVAIYVSVDYPEDPAVTQKWADFLSSLVHGSELSTVEVRLESSRQVRRLCGRLALACYSPSTHTIVVPFDQSPDGPSPESILAHEYGHHVASSRLNTPWDANDYGPKRWATAVGVCRKAQDGSLFPGDEGENYAFNPAEIFAEDYRLLNEQRLGLPISPWEIVDESTQPDQVVLDALAQDVTDPWTGQRTLTYPGSFRKDSSAAAPRLPDPDAARRQRGGADRLAEGDGVQGAAERAPDQLRERVRHPHGHRDRDAREGLRRVQADRVGSVRPRTGRRDLVRACRRRRRRHLFLPRPYWVGCRSHHER